jgi:hypothetical protein
VGDMARVRTLGRPRCRITAAADSRESTEELVTLITKQIQDHDSSSGTTPSRVWRHCDRTHSETTVLHYQGASLHSVTV